MVSTRSKIKTQANSLINETAELTPDMNHQQTEVDPMIKSISQPILDDMNGGVSHDLANGLPNGLTSGPQNGPQNGGENGTENGEETGLQNSSFSSSFSFDKKFHKPHSLSRILHDVDTDFSSSTKNNDGKSTASNTIDRANRSHPQRTKKFKIGYPTHVVDTDDVQIDATSIISHKIDNDAPSLNLTDSNDTDMDSVNSTPQPDAQLEIKVKRKYKVDRNNIRINKRIMSRDTEEVVKMFKKFDNEVLTNPEAKARLLSLGFETRKRYITTFKHYIRFCCEKNLDNFFVTGELMKEFYEEQFTKSTSDKPVIRLRKMDPAFSKLQEINFLVYHLPTKEIPNRHLALEYLIFKESGRLPVPKKKASSSDDTNEHIMQSKQKSKNSRDPSFPSPPLSQGDAPELKRRKKHVSKEETINYIRHSFLHTRRNIDSIVSEKLQLLHNTTMNNLVDTINSLLTGIYGQLDMFNHTIGEPPLPVEPATQEKPNSQAAPATEVKKEGKVPLIDMNHDIYTIYQILEEWRVIEPTIESRVAKWGTDWLRDEVDFETYSDRKKIIGFVDRLSKECNEPDTFVIANDCDRYIREKSILDEFISEIEINEDDLCKRIIRYRQRRT